MAASLYDKMINWDSRLGREIPVISSYFADLGENATIFDVCCSSGRHSLALNHLGFQTVGVDISASFIDFARQLSQDNHTAEIAEFVEIDASDKEMIRKFKGRYFDGAILLGNAIANMGNFTKGQQLIRNIFTLLRPGAKFFVQTVNKPEKPWYNPLRGKDGVIIQRIMVPEPIGPDSEQQHNVVLHVNQLRAEPLEYVSQKADNLFFMYRLDEFQTLVERTGFQVENVYSGYTKAEVEDIDGETLIWQLRKPEIELLPEGEALFSKYTGMTAEQVKSATLQ